MISWQKVHQCPNCACNHLFCFVAAPPWWVLAGVMVAGHALPSSAISKVSSSLVIAPTLVLSRWWARSNLCCSWKYDCPWRLWAFSIQQWSARVHISWPSVTCLWQPTIEHTLSLSQWTGQKQWWLFSKGTMQLGDTQQGWPIVIPSMTTTVVQDVADIQHKY